MSRSPTLPTPTPVTAVVPPAAARVVTFKIDDKDVSGRTDETILAIARQNNIALDTARVRETMNLIASTYEEPAQVIELYRNDPNLMRSLQNRVLEEQVMDWVAERADATDRNLSFAEVMRPAG